jgi:hypothetical protein
MTSKSPMLRIRDVRDAYRLIGECRDLSGDPALWQMRVFQGMHRLVGADAASGGEGFWNRPKPQQVVTFFDTFESRDRPHFLAYMRDGGPAADPIWRALGRMPGPLVTRTRRQLVPDTLWYRCASFTDYRRPAHVDHQLTSVRQVSNGAISVICVHRGLGERNFSDRKRRLLDFFHAELGMLIGRSLVSATEQSPDAFAPRLHQTLTCLLQGDSEKQVASRLGISGDDASVRKRAVPPVRRA